MLQNYITIAFRNFWRHRRFSIISVLSLAMSLSVLLLLGILLFDQWKIDRHHPDAERIYRVISKTDMVTSSSPSTLAPVLEAEYPGIEKTTRLRNASGDVLLDNGRLSYRGMYAEPSFFEIFDWSIREGGRALALGEPNQVLISEEWANRVFGDTDPVGQLLELESLRFSKKATFMVAGVINEVGKRSHLSFDVLISFNSQEELELERLSGWNTRLYKTYLRLAPGVAPEQLNEAFSNIRKQHYPNADQHGPDWNTFHLQPITSIALSSFTAGDHGVLPAEAGFILGVLGLLILLITCFTYTNLSLARAFERSLEVGVRKTMGARRWHIILQFLTEAVVLSLVALGIALTVLPLLIRSFNALFFTDDLGISLTYAPMNEPAILLLAVLLTVFLGIIAGLYPAITLSVTSPLKAITGSILSGNHQPAGRARLRRSLLSVQLCISFVLIVSTILLYRQASYMLYADYGFDIDRIIQVEVQDVEYEILRQEMLSQSGVEYVAGISELPAINMMAPYLYKADRHEEGVRLYEQNGDADVLSVLGVDLIEGNTFSSNGSSEVIINEIAARSLGFNSPAEAVGSTLHNDTESDPFTIIAVMQNFHLGSLFHSSLEPAAIFYRPDAQINHAIIRAEPEQHQTLLNHLETLWPTFGSTHNFKAGTYSDELKEYLTPFNDGLYLIGFTTMFTLIITMMGMFGMAVYSMQARTKEAGIRKILGASVIHLTGLLSKESLIISVLSIMVGIPLSWYLNRIWLELFPNRIAMGSGVFLAGFFVILIVLGVTVGWQSYRIATHNPVNSLRNE